MRCGPRWPSPSDPADTSAETAGETAGETSGAPSATGADPEPIWAAIHRAAVEAGEISYTDPATGYRVFTELAHRLRGECCGSACRHCPFGHVNVPEALRRGEP